MLNKPMEKRCWITHRLWCQDGKIVVTSNFSNAHPPFLRLRTPIRMNYDFHDANDMNKIRLGADRLLKRFAGVRDKRNNLVHFILHVPNSATSLSNMDAACPPPRDVDLNCSF